MGLNPEQIQQAQQARQDKLEAIRDGLEKDNRDLLTRFGARRALGFGTGASL